MTSADRVSLDAATSAPTRDGAAGSPDYPGLLQRVPAILYTAEPGAQGTWQYVSPQVETILGFTPEQWCADPETWLHQIHPDDLERVLAEELDPPDPGGPGAGAVEYRLLHRDGHVVWVRDDALLVRDSDGVRRWHGVMSDITDRKLAEVELERAAAQHAAAAALGEHALEGATPHELAREALTAAVDLLGVEIGAVIELTEDRSAFTFLAAHGLPDTGVAQPVPAGAQSQAGYAVLHGQTIVRDFTQETRFARAPALTQAGALSGVTVPIEGRRGTVGVLGVHSTRARDYSRIDVDFVQTLANVLGDAFDRQLTEDDIRHRALHDPLTALPNRVLFMDRLDQAVQRLRRGNARAAVLFLDLDRFKLVNDSLGHELGDELLGAAATRVKQTLRGSDTVARFGADEFAILLAEISGEHDAIEMAQRIAAVFTRPFILGGEEHFVTTSIGISLAAGGERAEDLVRDAEAAMHRAKERGGARYELYDEGIRGRSISRLRVENDLRRALERDELTLDYQPVVSLPDRAIVGVEALLRWDHPDRGRVAPGEFIPIAEENGLIEPIGRWVLEHACRQGAVWYHARPDAPPISVAVNLSAVQFESRNLPETVANALQGAGFDPSLLSLEVTESVMLGDADELTRMLAALKQVGARLILDDFGTGYSSLAYLTRLPLDVLKVDRSFVDGLGTEPRDTAITEAIIAMSHALGLAVVGEGAETDLQVAELRRLGCDLVQGFYFARPVPAAEITAMLQTGPPWLTRRAAR